MPTGGRQQERKDDFIIQLLCLCDFLDSIILTGVGGIDGPSFTILPRKKKTKRVFVENDNHVGLFAR